MRIISLSLIIIISLVSGFITAIGVLAELFGILDNKYVGIIIDINIIVQLTLLSAFIAMYILSRKLPNGVTLIRYQFENRLIKGDTEIFPESFSSTNPLNKSIFRIQWEVKEFIDPPEFNITKTGNNQKFDIKKHIINVNSGIKENIFVFRADIIVRPNEYVNCKFSKDTNVKSFSLGELYLP